MADSPSEAEYLTKSELKERGWTEKAISLFLGECDKEAKNLYYSKAPPVRLYLKSRVEAVERSEAYQNFLLKNANRVSGARKAAETKKLRLLEEVAGWTIELEARPYPEIVEAAIEAYNSYRKMLYYDRARDYTPANTDSDPEFLQRITVNYLRHELSDYEYRLRVLFGKVGKTEGYRILNKKIYDKIASTYPQLRDECNRQMARRCHCADGQDTNTQE